MFSTDAGVEQESAAFRFCEATALTEAEVVGLQEVVRKRVLALFERRGLLTSEAVAEMRKWEHGGGFSLDASIRIRANDRAGLERQLRYCARPPFSRERLCWSRTGEHVLYQLPKPRPDGQTMLRLGPIELLDRLASLAPARSLALYRPESTGRFRIGLPPPQGHQSRRLCGAPRRRDLP